MISTKIKRAYLLSLLLTVLITSCGRKSEHAAEYNDSIVSKQLDIIRAFDLLDSAFNNLSSSPEQINYAYTNLRARSMEGMLALDSIGSFQKDPSLQLAAKELFGTYVSMAERDYSKLVQIKMLPEDAVTTAVVDSNIAVTKRIHDLSKQAQDKFLKAQEDFGKKYNLVFE